MAKKKTKAAAPEVEAEPPAKRGPGRVSADGVNRSKFIRDLLLANPKISSTEVKQAWADSGNTGKLNITTFYMLRSKLFAKKSKRTAAAVPQVAAAARKSRAPSPVFTGSSGYAAIEESLDHYVLAAVQIGDAGLADALRVARRYVSAKIA